jgi:hypothetical protein
MMANKYVFVYTFKLHQYTRFTKKKQPSHFSDISVELGTMLLTTACTMIIFIYRVSREIKKTNQSILVELLSWKINLAEHLV